MQANFDFSDLAHGLKSFSPPGRSPLLDCRNSPATALRPLSWTQTIIGKVVYCGCPYPIIRKQLTLLINAELSASNTNALLFHVLFVDLEASLSSLIQGFSLVKKEIEVIRFSLLPPSSAITLPTPAQPKTFLLENSFQQKSFTAPFFNTKWGSTSLSNLTYRCSFSNYSIQLDDVAMFKLSHDGCFLQEFQTVLWREIIFQGLNGHGQQQNTRSIVLQQTWRRWSLKSITPMILKSKEEFAINTRPSFLNSIPPPPSSPQPIHSFRKSSRKQLDLKVNIMTVADPGRGARGARYPLKKKKKKKGKKKHVDLVHDELKRDPYEDTDVEVDERFKRANWKPKGKGAHWARTSRAIGKWEMSLQGRSNMINIRPWIYPGRRLRTRKKLSFRLSWAWSGRWHLATLSGFAPGELTPVKFPSQRARRWVDEHFQTIEVGLESNAAIASKWGRN